MTTRTLYHPTLNTSVEVPEQHVEAWVAQGWRKTKPAASKEQANG